MPLNFDPIAFVMALIMMIMAAIQLHWTRPQRTGLRPGANVTP
jgi:hypothetical protein